MMFTVFQASPVGSYSQSSVARSQQRHAWVSRRRAGVRRPVMRRASGNPKDGQGNTPGLPRPDPNQTTEQTKDVSEPKVDQSKVENIAAGNISNENAERRADLGATRPPTLFGKLVGSSVSSANAAFDLHRARHLFLFDVTLLYCCRGSVF